MSFAIYLTPPAPSRSRLRATLSTMNGLLSPEGKLYACCYEGHEDLAETICEELYHNEQDQTEKWKYLEQDWLLKVKKFVKLQTHDEETSGNSTWRARTPIAWDADLEDITQKQRDTIFDWCMEHDEELPGKLRPDSVIAG